MPIERPLPSHAWLLHKTWSGNTSARLTLFTPDRGLIHAWYQGARSIKKQGMLQVFTPLWMALTERRGWYYVQQLEIAAPSLAFSRDALYAALYVNELIYLALYPEEQCIALFDAYFATLQALSQTPSRVVLEASLRRFEWQLLRALGYPLSFTYEAATDRPIVANHLYRLVVGQGFLRADKGIPGAHLLALGQDILDDTVLLKTAKYIMRQVIDHALGGKAIKTRLFLRNNHYSP